MKITKSQLKQIIKEELGKVMNEDDSDSSYYSPLSPDDPRREGLPEEVRGIDVVVREDETEEYEMEFDSGVKRYIYDIVLDGKTVGEVDYDTYFGNMTGHLFGRRIRLKYYDNVERIRPQVLGSLVRFLKSDTGRKFLDSRTVRRFMGGE